MATDILLAEGFGHMTDGAHAAGTSTELLGLQWSSFLNTFAIEDEGDGRKWIKRNTTDDEYKFVSRSWTGERSNWLVKSSRVVPAGFYPGMWWKETLPEILNPWLQT